ncbi:alpha/beta hydrolase [Streptomyces sp. NPDC006475]|uniref:alpha/beta fold hydrolase n=1 Tax=Streptomyces sp. NPDC006475 TaxID=3155719 RepID=UPI0033B235FA
MHEFVFEGSDGCVLRAAALGQGPTLVLMHGVGQDHRSLLPLASLLADRFTMILPDVRGYGRSVCTDPARHTWAQYADDVESLLNHLGLRRAAVGGTGLGGTIALRTAASRPDLVRASVVISLEDVQDDAAKQAETAMLNRFATRVIEEGIEAAWAPLLPSLAPVIRALVRDAIPRTNPASIAAACAIGRDRAFARVADLAAISAPTLIIPGADDPHPTALAAEAAHTLPHGQLSSTSLTTVLHTAADLAAVVGPAIRDFLTTQLTIHTAEAPDS